MTSVTGRAYVCRFEQCAVIDEKIEKKTLSEVSPSEWN